MDWREKVKNRQNKRKRFLRSFAITLLAIFLVGYGAAAVYFAGHFAFNTTVNGTDAFKKTAEELENETLGHLEQYVLTVHARGGMDEQITSAQLQLIPRFGSQFKDILKGQNPLMWPVYLFKPTELTTETVVELSGDSLEKAVKALGIFAPESIVEPENAHISETSGDNGFYVVEQTGGTSPILSRVLEEVGDAARILEPEITLSDECYKKAAVTSEDETLQTLCKNLNKYCSVNLVYSFGEDEVRVDGTRVKDWCDIDGVQVSLNPEKIRDFVNLMARTYDTFGKTRKLKSHGGDIVEVEGGDYGWWMDRATETSELTEAVKNGEKGEREPVYFGRAAAYGDEDWGDSYVEINLDEQHLWVYEEGRVVEESDFVSGCVNKRRTTPVGTYAITYKDTDTYLTGDNYSSHVDYWMPFNGNVGMHDASWRSSFGGEIYVTNGSHGCVNLPKKKAAAIYDIVKKGEAVLVYGGKTLPEEEPEEETPDAEELTPEQQLQLLIEAGYLNPDGTPVE